MFVNPDLRKRYFSIVDLAEIEENDCSLHVPRYVDTFEPEEEIRLDVAKAGFSDAIRSEQELTAKIRKTLALPVE
jgi:type I restriction enzyme M protein